MADLEKQMEDIIKKISELKEFKKTPEEFDTSFSTAYTKAVELQEKSLKRMFEEERLTSTEYAEVYTKIMSGLRERVFKEVMEKSKFLSEMASKSLLDKVTLELKARLEFAKLKTEEAKNKLYENQSRAYRDDARLKAAKLQMDGYNVRQTMSQNPATIPLFNDSSITDTMNEVFGKLNMTKAASTKNAAKDFVGDYTDPTPNDNSNDPE